MMNLWKIYLILKKILNKNLSKKYYKDSFYEIEKVAQLEKLMNVKNLIFRIKKRRKKNFIKKFNSH